MVHDGRIPQDSSWKAQRDESALAEVIHKVGLRFAAWRGRTAWTFHSFINTGGAVPVVSGCIITLMGDILTYGLITCYKHSSAASPSAAPSSDFFWFFWPSFLCLWTRLYLLTQGSILDALRSFREADSSRWRQRILLSWTRQPATSRLKNTRLVWLRVGDTSWFIGGYAITQNIFKECLQTDLFFSWDGIGVVGVVSMAYLKQVWRHIIYIWRAEQRAKPIHSNAAKQGIDMPQAYC